MSLKRQKKGLLYSLYGVAQYFSCTKNLRGIFQVIGDRWELHRYFDN